MRANTVCGIIFKEIIDAFIYDFLETLIMGFSLPLVHEKNIDKTIVIHQMSYIHKHFATNFML